MSRALSWKIRDYLIEVQSFLDADQLGGWIIYKRNEWVAFHRAHYSYATSLRLFIIVSEYFAQRKTLCFRCIYEARIMQSSTIIIRTRYIINSWAILCANLSEITAKWWDSKTHVTNKLYEHLKSILLLRRREKNYSSANYFSLEDLPEAPTSAGPVRKRVVIAKEIVRIG